MDQLPIKLANGYTAEELDSETREKGTRLFSGQCNDFVRLQPGGWILSRRYLQIADEIHNFKFRPDDVIVMTYPKCGSTWMQEIVWNMRNNPNLDNPDADDLVLLRSPCLESDQFSYEDNLSSLWNINFTIVKTFVKNVIKLRRLPDFRRGFMLDHVETQTQPRVIKTHLPFCLLPQNLLDTCKVVYTYRNPMDNLLSFKHFSELMKSFSFIGSQDEFVDLYISNSLPYSPYGQHLREAMSRRHHPNLFLTSYEQLKKDIRGEMKRLDAFLDTELTGKQIDNVLEKTSFQTMKECDDLKKIPQVINKDVGQRQGLFFRQGKSGAWKDKFTPEQKAKLDAWIKTNFTDHGITFEYD